MEIKHLKFIGGSASDIELFKRNASKLLESIQNWLSSYNVTDDALESVQVCISVNSQIGLPGPYNFGGWISLWYLNFPTKISTNISTSDAILRARLSNILDSSGQKRPDGIEKIGIIIVYNKTDDELAQLFKNSNSLKESANEEGLAFFTATNPKYRMDQLILPPELVGDIEDALVILEKRELIYDTWGFSEVDPSPKAVLNFYGLPGTGKTMCAHGIASRLGLKILALNYADIESKFVGDAPKNLVRSFKTAEEQKAVLFFDEADSFLGKRITNVSSSSDQAVNSLRSQMLIQLENFNGFVIFATNLLKNYDRAFESRVFKHLKFELPTEAARKEIIRKMLPQKLPGREFIANEEALQTIAASIEGFSGREIRNTILESLTVAAKSPEQKIEYKHFEECFQKAKTRKDTLEDEVGNSGEKMSPSRKKGLEDMIKTNLEIEEVEQAKCCSNNIDENMADFDSADSAMGIDGSQAFEYCMMNVAAHAAYADGIVHESERQVLEKTAAVLKVKLPLYSYDKLPGLEDHFDSIDNIEKKMKVLELALYVVTSDGDFSSSEKEFVRKLCVLLRIEDQNVVDEILSFSEEMARLEMRRLKLKDVI